ncbi:hypothetical protein BD324DRAFT_101146 [Kockovaella imperatae]|uniref:CipC-like antibiotic response protein n=1 Tax=Kockovaella imperatae TaxID=4999 RepID=A0A1Y1UBS5_9TREE|nr:hypothetical protein BD324DRAFT_101146 [Kockovaella imperatae]ORX35469.1 hypothetical protein BD324DRAFT_101146 [Kockovaella imperatae]
MFDKLRAKIDGHFHSSPLASQRKDFLAVNASTPIEKKAHFTAEVVGAAAAYEAFKRHEVHKGAKPTHARAKEIIVGLATGFASKMIDEKALPFTSEAQKIKFKKEAQLYAARDAKRAVRDSGLYEVNELEPIDGDKKHGSKML